MRATTGAEDDRSQDAAAQPLLRVATPEDIPALMRVRLSVRENELSDPSRVTPADCEQHLHALGRTWVIESEGEVVAFAAGRTRDGEIWALFVDPRHEGRGLGGRLHDAMVDWLFGQGLARLRLGTTPGTRAERFYRLRGWVDDPDCRGHVREPADEVRLVLDRAASPFTALDAS